MGSLLTELPSLAPPIIVACLASSLEVVFILFERAELSARLGVLAHSSVPSVSRAVPFPNFQLEGALSGQVIERFCVRTPRTWLPSARAREQARVFAVG